MPLCINAIKSLIWLCLCFSKCYCTWVNNSIFLFCSCLILRFPFSALSLLDCSTQPCTTVPLFCSSIHQQFCYCAVPPFYCSTIPHFHYTTIKLFYHWTVPSILYSAILQLHFPLIHHSKVPSFLHSSIP